MRHMDLVLRESLGVNELPEQKQTRTKRKHELNLGLIH
jgi:hypothetical protein